MTALDRFAAKCRFEPETGCIIWTGGTCPCNAGRERMGVFKYEGKRWPARRWAARFIYGQSIDHGNETMVTCGEPLCVRHVKADAPYGNTRQHWLLVNLGYDEGGSDEERAAMEQRRRQALRDAIPLEERTLPDWFRPYLPEEERARYDALDDVPF